MHVIFMGPQGAGKGTQAERVAPLLGLAHVSTGDLFRAAMKNGTPLGVMARGFLDRGELVPDDVTIGIVVERIDQIAAEHAAGRAVSGAIFDGFPRTAAQAEGLDAALASRADAIGAVVEITAPRDVLIERLSGRRVCAGCGATYHVQFAPPAVAGVCDQCGGEVKQRADDTPDAIQRRLALYDEQTAPLLAYYRDRGLLVTIDGDRDPAAVTGDVVAAIQSRARN
jgi:adenylate kinase